MDKDNFIEPTETKSNEPTEATSSSNQDNEGKTKSGLHRRKFLTAAALGTAAAALLGRSESGGLSIGASSVVAHTDTKSACTAQDIEVSSGVIINEPCSCTPNGTFGAVAAFQVTNNNNATRKCITLHLGAGGTLGGKDFLLTTNPSGIPNGSDSNIDGKGTTQTMYAFLGNVSCNFGKECYPGSVVAFQTAQNQADSPCTGPLEKYPGGQCRREEICIIGFGASLSCATDGTCTSTGSASCSVSCGSSLYLKATANGGTAGASGTYTFTVTDKDGTTVASATNAASPQCFTIANPTSGTYTLTVADSNSCTRTATTSVTVINNVGVTLAQTSAGCDGVVTLTATGSGGNGSYSYTFSGATGTVNNNTITLQPQLDGQCRTVSVYANSGGCKSPTVSYSFSQCATTTAC